MDERHPYIVELSCSGETLEIQTVTSWLGAGPSILMDGPLRRIRLRSGEFPAAAVEEA